MLNINKKQHNLIKAFLLFLFFSFSGQINHHEPERKPKKYQIQIQKEKEEKNFSSSSKNNSYRFFINLAEFKNILFENEKAIDSSVICPGGYRRRTPLLAVNKKVIVIRPAFFPTKAERDQFRAAFPDRTSQPANPKNPLGRVKIDLHNVEGLLIRMHGTSLVKSIGEFKDGEVVNYKFASNGCIRNNNLAIEKMIGRVIGNSEIKKVFPLKSNKEIEELIKEYKNFKIEDWEIINKTTKGRSIIIELEKPIQIDVVYRLWDIISYTDSTIEFRIHIDLYNYLDGKREIRVIKPYQLNREENAYNFEHFCRDLEKKKIYLNKLEQKESWQKLKKMIEKNKNTNKKIFIRLNKS
ncbi:MAG: L,D-transpeptidase family protein [Candidatus Anstonellaceae archaeon]